ncbi:YceI family protein [Fibrella aquatilis]|uniref:YceI family protein n=1 Tax=Fibrella aquatilis TaxID=2817059 RepID=A0A939G7E7_9BACT|nr:YceI family protein [Fibrella aquatilis]MBO0933574.1 YceI family protein [Fibrella aquatilis]
MPGINLSFQRLISRIGTLLLLPLLAVAPQAVPASGTYAVDANESQVYWTGRSEIGKYSLSGVVPVASGSITVEGGLLKTGLVEINMTAISCNTLDNGASNQKLITHLSSPDFFDVKKYPKATFVMTRAIPKGGNAYELAGNLTIKDKTNPIQFPATLQEQQGKLLLKTLLVVDRAKFDVRYGSNSFFDNLGNDAIKNEFELDIELLTQKKK